MTPRVMLLATTTGYQVRSFDQAARRTGVELVLATDRCATLEDPWRDAAVPVRFHEEHASVSAILEAARHRPLDGVLAVGDRPTVLAALAARALDLPGHPPSAVRLAGNKLLCRQAFRDAGLPTPWFRSFSLDVDPREAVGQVVFPCVVKPTSLAGSRGVMRADDPQGFIEAVDRLRRLLRGKDVRALRDAALDDLVVEGYIPGDEVALEGVLERGELRVLALFDKPDPLEGPFFEETIYVTPSRAPADRRRRVAEAVAEAARSLGLAHGPVHAECRLDGEAVFVLEVAARPIGGLCARALRFLDGADDAGRSLTLEEVLLRHATGRSLDGVAREDEASGVMMIPIPQAGRLRGVEGVRAASRVPGVDEVVITAKPDQVLVPLPEGASYLGFIFARGQRPDEVVESLRRSHARLRFSIEPALSVV